MRINFNLYHYAYAKSLCQNVIHELNQTCFYLIPKVQFIVDFVAIAAISLNRNLVTAIGQQISYMVQAFAVVATGVLVTAN